MNTANKFQESKPAISRAAPETERWQTIPLKEEQPLMETALPHDNTLFKTNSFAWVLSRCAEATKA
jgi:hypothetical protein